MLTYASPVTYFYNVVYFISKYICKIHIIGIFPTNVNQFTIVSVNAVGYSTLTECYAHDHDC